MDTPEQDIPIPNGKIVLYAHGIKRPVFTDFVLVACCHRIGSHFIKVRRRYIDLATNDLFRMRWDELKGYDGL